MVQPCDAACTAVMHSAAVVAASPAAPLAAAGLASAAHTNTESSANHSECDRCCFSEDGNRVLTA